MFSFRKTRRKFQGRFSFYNVLFTTSVEVTCLFLGDAFPLWSLKMPKLCEAYGSKRHLSAAIKA